MLHRDLMREDKSSIDLDMLHVQTVDMEATPTTAQVVGANVRRLRGDQRQDELASEARGYGLSWTQATVAAIEKGRRRISLEELPVICLVLLCNPADLFDGDGAVELADGVTGELDAVRKLFNGRFDEVRPYGQFSSPALDAGKQKFSEGMKSFGKRLDLWRRLWPGDEHTVERHEEVQRAASGEAEIKAARRLGVDPLDLSVAAYGLYGHSMTTERDERVNARTEADAPARSLQAIRGHVSRELIDELRERFNAAEGND